MREALLKNALGVVNLADGTLSGANVRESSKTMGQMGKIFRDREAWAQIAPDRLIYKVQWIPPVDDGTEGGLFWGNTTIEPGMVNDEYFMTHGHYHSKSDRSEFYATVRGKGYLVMMDRNRYAWAEPMSPGSLHYIPVDTAHRVVNCGDEQLRFLACWPSDAGHDYGTIADHGFSLRVVNRNGQPTLIAVNDVSFS